MKFLLFVSSFVIGSVAFATTPAAPFTPLRNECSRVVQGAGTAGVVPVEICRVIFSGTAIHGLTFTYSDGETKAFKTVRVAEIPNRVSNTRSLQSKLDLVFFGIIVKDKFSLVENGFTIGATLTLDNNNMRHATSLEVIYPQWLMLRATNFQAKDDYLRSY